MVGIAVGVPNPRGPARLGDIVVATGRRRTCQTWLNVPFTWGYSRFMVLSVALRLAPRACQHHGTSITALLMSGPPCHWCNMCPRARGSPAASPVTRLRHHGNCRYPGNGPLYLMRLSSLNPTSPAAHAVVVPGTRASA
jgi:hypothetical protein